MPRYLSPAFLQQCYFSHRASLVIKEIRPEAVVFRCGDCNFLHSLEVRLMAPSGTESQDLGQPPNAEDPSRCAADHFHAVRIQKVNAVQDAIELHCADCFNTYRFSIAKCETTEDRRSLGQAMGPDPPTGH